jgi:hypothetical protein
MLGDFSIYAYKDDAVREKEFQSFHVVRDVETGNVSVFPEKDITRIQRDIFEIEN